MITQLKTDIQAIDNCLLSTSTPEENKPGLQETRDSLISELNNARIKKQNQIQKGTATITKRIQRITATEQLNERLNSKPTPSH